jgi:DNA-binding NarL/FixJ family response regulator
MKNLDIVIVDDHEIYRVTLAKIIGSIFYNCCIDEFASGEAFLKMLKRSRNIDLVLMDIKLPGIDGVETTRRAIIIRPDLPVLAISIKHDLDEITKLKYAGAKGFLLKGGGKQGIKEAIESVLNNEMFFDHIG